MTAICASFADFKLIKGRKVCQLVCEVPLEQADAALAALGGLPNPHAERWVGIAPLTEQPQVQPSPGPAGGGNAGNSSQRAGDVTCQTAVSPAAAKPKRDWDDIPPSQQAGIACADRRFGEWLTQFHDMPVLDGSPSEIAGHLRLVLNLRSRSELDTNPEAAARWRDLYGKFQTDTRYGDRR